MTDDQNGDVPAPVNWPVDRITVGERFRRDLGDVRVLADSIARLGLLHPIVIRPDGRLVAGARRLTACRDILGMAEVPVRVIDVDAIVRGEAEENAQRLGFAPEEALDVYEGVLSEEKRLAKERQKEAARRAGIESGKARRGEREDANVPENLRNVQEREVGGEARTLAAHVTGYSWRSLEMAGEVVAAAKAEPGVFGEIREEMSRSRNINKAHAAMKRILREREMAKQRKPGAGSVQLYHADAVTFLQTIVDPASADLLLTDPPYMTDVEDIWSFAEWVQHGLRVLRPSGRFYVFTGAYPYELAAYALAFEKHLPAGWTLDNILVWTYRNTIGPTPTHGYKLNWQACFYGYGPDAPPLACHSLNEQFTVQDINAPDARTGVRLHPWQKPDELATRLIVHSTQPGDLVVEPFAGTGTFVAAASDLGRDVIACDTDPAMLALCEKRGLEVAA